MKITIESTPKIIEADDLRLRVWEGHTESGTPVICFILQVAVLRELDCSDFERELIELPVPEGFNMKKCL